MKYDNPSTLQKLDRYCSFFLQRKTDYEVDLRTFRNGMVKLKEQLLKLSKHKSNDKKDCFEIFAPNIFFNMPERKKSKHSLAHCEGCLTNFTKGMEKFSGVKKEKLFSLNNPLNISTTLGPQKAALNVIHSLDNTFKKKFQTSFTETLVKLPESGISTKLTDYEKKQQKRKQLRDITAYINNDLNSTAVDRCLGTRQSLSSRKKDRILRSHESYNDAQIRVHERLAKENMGIVKTKSHTGIIEKMNWDKEGLLKATVKSFFQKKSEFFFYTI